MKKLLSILPYFAGMVLSLTGMAFSLTGRLHTTTEAEIVTFSLSFLIGIISAIGAGYTIREFFSKEC